MTVRYKYLSINEKQINNGNECHRSQQQHKPTEFKCRWILSAILNQITKYDNYNFQFIEAEL